MGFAKIASVKEGLAFFNVFDDIKLFGVLKLVGTYNHAWLAWECLLLSFLKLIPYFWHNKFQY